MIKSTQTTQGEIVILELKGKEIKEPIFLYIPLLSPTAMKLLYLIWSNIKWEGDYIYKAKLKEVATYLGISPSNVHKTIREAGKKLLELRIEQDKKKGFMIGGFINMIKVAEGELYIKTLPEIQTLIKTIKQHYAKFDIRNLLGLRTKYEISLYKFLRNQLNIHHHYQRKSISDKYHFFIIETTKETLYKELQVPPTYLWNKVTSRILDKAKIDLGQHTDLLFNYSVKRGGRGNKRIEKITFAIADLTDKHNLTTYMRETIPGRFLWWRGKWYKARVMDGGIVELDGKGVSVDIWTWREMIEETQRRIDELRRLQWEEDQRRLKNLQRADQLIKEISQRKRIKQ
jgi:hypothetical protein